VIVARISEQTLLTVNTIELFGIVYLAIAVSALRERIAKLEGKAQQRERDEDAEK
jgi:hypothetical protein